MLSDGAANITAKDISLNSNDNIGSAAKYLVIDIVSGKLDATATNDIYLKSISALTDITSIESTSANVFFVADGDVNAESIKAAENVTINVTGNTTVTEITATNGNVNVTVEGTANITTVTAGTDIVATVTGATTIETATAGNSADLNITGTLNAKTITAGANATINTSAKATVETVKATTGNIEITVTDGGANITTATAGTDMAITVTGDTVITEASAGNKSVITVTGNASIGVIKAKNVEISSTGAIINIIDKDDLYNIEAEIAKITALSLGTAEKPFTNKLSGKSELNVNIVNNIYINDYSEDLSIGELVSTDGNIVLNVEENLASAALIKGKDITINVGGTADITSIIAKGLSTDEESEDGQPIMIRYNVKIKAKSDLSIGTIYALNIAVTVYGDCDIDKIHSIGNVKLDAIL